MMRGEAQPRALGHDVSPAMDGMSEEEMLEMAMRR